MNFALVLCLAAFATALPKDSASIRVKKEATGAASVASSAASEEGSGSGDGAGGASSATSSTASSAAGASSSAVGAASGATSSTDSSASSSAASTAASTTAAAPLYSLIPFYEPEVVMIRCLVPVNHHHFMHRILEIRYLERPYPVVAQNQLIERPYPVIKPAFVERSVYMNRLRTIHTNTHAHDEGYNVDYGYGDLGYGYSGYSGGYGRYGLGYSDYGHGFGGYRDFGYGGNLGFRGDFYGGYRFKRDLGEQITSEDDQLPPAPY